MGKIINRQLCITLLLMLFCCFCKVATIDSIQKQANYKINLRWSPSFVEETPERAEIGLQWILSYLGAMLPKGSFEEAVVWKDEQILTLDISKVGFSEKALMVWAKLLAPMKASEEYFKMGGIDLGRFYLLTFNSSWHYYALTDVSPTFNEFLEAYSFEAPIGLGKGESGITKGCRILYLAQDTITLDQMAYYAIEGTGDVNDNTFEPVDYEVFDFMPNGQPRFAIYDVNGNLRTAASAKLSIGGKPSKCMWCHESKIQPSFKRKPNQKLTNLNQKIIPRRDELLALQQQLNTEVHFDSLAHHRNAEFPSGSFMECNVSRISNEFQIDSMEFKAFLENLETHTTPHFPEFQTYYDRIDIEDLQPYNALKVPTHMWEESIYEPNFLKSNNQ